MNQTEQLHGISPEDVTDDAQCPNCESTNMTDRGSTCNDCEWSLPSLSTTEVTGDHVPYERCDHCGDEMRMGPCEDCIVSEGLETTDNDNVEVIESDDAVVIDNTDSTQATLDELLAESDIIDGDDSDVLAD